MANPFVHLELTAGDPKAAQKFYSKLFSWKIGAPMKDMGNYQLIDFGTKGTGGGLSAPMMPGQPTAWLSYIQVDSVKKTMAKAVKAGAKAVVPYQPIGDQGAIGVFVDPQGAALGLWEKGKPARKSAAKRSSKKPSKKK